MKKQIIRVLVLALVVLAVVLLHKRVRYEAEEAEKRTAEALAPSVSAPETDEGRAIPRAGESVTLGKMAANTERGGVDITVTDADGTEKVYSFTDVAPDSWYADAVNFVVSAGLMSGSTGEARFRPEYGVPRELFASVLCRFAGGEPTAAGASFSDVPEGVWYADAVRWAVREGLMTAIGEDVFGVGAYMTCEQVIIVLYRLAGEPRTDGTLTDYPYAAKVSESGRDAIDWAWQNGLITEVECVWYPPQAISRAQLALLLTRFGGMFS